MKKRVTIEMEKSLDYRLEVHAAISGKGKNELAAIALEAYLPTQQGYEEVCELIKRFRPRKSRKKAVK